MLLREFQIYQILDFSKQYSYISHTQLTVTVQPVSLNVDIEEDDDDEHFESFPELPVPPPGLSNNLLQIARPLPPARARPQSSSSPPCSPLNLHISRPNSPSQTTASQPSPCPSKDPSHQPIVTLHTDLCVLPSVSVSSQPLPQDPSPQPPPQPPSHASYAGR